MKAHEGRRHAQLEVFLVHLGVVCSGSSARSRGGAGWCGGAAPRSCGSTCSCAGDTGMEGSCWGEGLWPGGSCCCGGHGCSPSCSARNSHRTAAASEKEKMGIDEWFRHHNGWTVQWRQIIKSLELKTRMGRMHTYFQIKGPNWTQTSESAVRHRRRLESVPQTNHGIKSDTVTWVRLQNKACLRSLEGDTITSTESHDPTNPFLGQSCNVVRTHKYKGKSTKKRKEQQLLLLLLLLY